MTSFPKGGGGSDHDDVTHFLFWKLVGNIIPARVILIIFAFPKMDDDLGRGGQKS